VTRDPHRFQAEALAAEGDRLVAMMLNRGTITHAPLVTALAALATLHLDLAGPEPAVETASAWVPQTGWLFEHTSGNWELRYVYPSELNDVHPKVGWYLEGAGTFCQWMAADHLGEAQRLADEHIAKQATA
jgi:hypothetical protein